MAVNPTESEFSALQGTKFLIKVQTLEVPLELVEVKGYLNQQTEQAGMERFSAFFDGALESFLPQGMYLMQHESLGEFEIFLVPIAQNQNGFRYEAVFNFFKD